MQQQHAVPPVRRASLLVVFIIMIATLIYVLTSGIENAVDPVSLLPVDTALLVDLKNPAFSITGLSRSYLGRHMVSTAWKEVLRDTGMPEDDVGYFVNRIWTFRRAIESVFFTELIGKRVLCGLIPAPVEKNLHNIKKKPSHQMVIIARPMHKALLVDFFSNFFVSKSKYTKQSYKGRIIKTYAFDNNLSFSTSVTEGLFIASFSTKAVQRCIDISLKNMTTGQSGLQANATYSRLRKRAGNKDDLFVYISLSNMRNTIYPAAKQDNYSQQGSFQNAAFFRQPQKNLIRYTGVIQYNADGVRQDFSFLQSYQPGRDTALAQLPDDIIAHVWTNVLNLEAAWALLQHSRSYSFMQPYMHNFETWLLENTALTVSDFLSLFGYRVSLNVTEITSSVFFPMPRMYLRVEVNDQEKVDQFLKDLFAGLRVQRSIVNNTEVFTLMLADGLVQPSYMLTNGFLVIGDSRQQLKDLLTKNSKPLLKSPLYDKIDVGLAQNNNLIIFHRGAELIDGLKELLLWYGSLLPPGDNNSGKKNKVIINTILIPTLENIKKYKAKSMRIYNTGSDIVIQSALLMEK